MAQRVVIDSYIRMKRGGSLLIAHVEPLQEDAARPERPGHRRKARIQRGRLQQGDRDDVACATDQLRG
jgi:hypothetical protein